MNNHTDLLNYLVKKFELRTYLEIGVQRKINFNKIDIALKVSVDPDPEACADFVGTSDKYFSYAGRKFDLIFIDGDHTAAQAKKDFDNSLQRLNRFGFIVLHDTNPAEELHTIVPRATKIWNGDVYKFVCQLAVYPEIDYCTFPFDHGCTVVWKTCNKVRLDKINWQFFKKNKEKLLRFTSIEKFNPLQL